MTKEETLAWMKARIEEEMPTIQGRFDGETENGFYFGYLVKPHPPGAFPSRVMLNNSLVIPGAFGIFVSRNDEITTIHCTISSSMFDFYLSEGNIELVPAMNEDGEQMMYFGLPLQSFDWVSVRNEKQNLMRKGEWDAKKFPWSGVSRNL